MKTKTLVLLLLWVAILIEGTKTLICRNIKKCAKFAEKWNFLSLDFNSGWLYVYIILAIFGVVTVLLMEGKENSQYEKKKGKGKKKKKEEERRKKKEDKKKKSKKVKSAIL